METRHTLDTLRNITAEEFKLLGLEAVMYCKVEYDDDGLTITLYAADGKRIASYPSFAKAKEEIREHGFTLLWTH